MSYWGLPEPPHFLPAGGLRCGSDSLSLMKQSVMQHRIRANCNPKSLLRFRLTARPGWQDLKVEEVQPVNKPARPALPPDYNVLFVLRTLPHSNDVSKRQSESLRGTRATSQTDFTRQETPSSSSPRQRRVEPQTNNRWCLPMLPESQRKRRVTPEIMDAPLLLQLTMNNSWDHNQWCFQEQKLPLEEALFRLSQFGNLGQDKVKRG